MKRTMFICMAAIYASTTRVLVDTFIPQILLVPKKTASIAYANSNANYYAHWFLTSNYTPPSKEHYLLLPHTKNDECDVLRMSYQVGDDIVTLSQTKYMMLCQIANVHKSSSLLQVSQIKLLMNSVFQNIDVDKHFVAFNSQTNRLESVTDPKGTGTSWWQFPGSVGFYQIKDDGKLNSSVPNLMLINNAYWFTDRPDHISVNSETIGKQFDLAQMVSPPDTPFIQQLKVNALVWDANHLTKGLTIPDGMLYSAVPASRFGGLDVVQISYEAHDKIITINHSHRLSIVQVEQQRTNGNSPLSNEDVATLAKSIFHNVSKIKAIDPQSITFKTVINSSKDAMKSKPSPLESNTLFWWQEAGQVSFFFPL